MSVGQLLLQGGWAMVPIYACSFVALVVFLKKYFEIRALKISDWTWLEPTLKQVEAGDIAAARAQLEGRIHPGALALAAMVAVVEKRPDRVEAEAQRVGSLQIQRLEGGLGILSFIAQAAPLLGLFGTVLGMLDLFLGLEGASIGGVDVARLSSGIWKALLTTAAGLMVAVPTLAAFSYLSARADRLRLELKDAISRFLTATPEA